MEWPKAIYGALGAPYPVLSLIVVTMLGAIIFGGGWWIIGREYQKEHQIQQTSRDNQKSSVIQDNAIPKTTRPPDQPNGKIGAASTSPSAQKEKVKMENEKTSPKINASPGSVISINQRGGITANTVNVHTGLPTPKVKWDVLSKNVPEGDHFKTEYVIEIIAAVPVRDLWIWGKASSVISITATPTRTGMYAMGPGPVENGSAEFHIQDATGRWQVTVLTKDAEDVRLEFGGK